MDDKNSILVKNLRLVGKCPTIDAFCPHTHRKLFSCALESVLRLVKAKRLSIVNFGDILCEFFALANHRHDKAQMELVDG